MPLLPTIKTLDVFFLNQSSVIANYLIPSSQGLILVETGPETTFEHLKTAIAEQGYNWKEVKHVLLTHIHFDHAGAAWKFAEQGAKIYVHPIGVPHLHNPEKLWNSAKRIYKDDMERLWGSMQPIAQEQLVPVEDGKILRFGDLEFKAIYTPGHAIHHNAYMLDDVIFTGDVAGVRINNGPVVPPCPPPDIDIEAWKNSIQKLRNQQPKKLYLAHFGEISDPVSHLANLEIMLDDWKNWMKPNFDTRAEPSELIPEFVEYTHQQLKSFGMSADDIDRYDKGNPAYMSVTGLLRYWKLKSQGRL